tara:strand:- start:152 stop:337 length:186 start_codon:yes stop_codon:yes gene_type:complete
MRFNSKGLVVEDQGNQQLYIPWRHVRGLYEWVVLFENTYQTYPGYKFTREQVGVILAHYAE